MSNRIIIFLFILGFLLRLSLAFIIPYPHYPEKIDDSYQYDVMALNILQGHGFSQKESAPFEPTICRTPIYPFFLASVFGVFGHSYIAVFVIQAILSTLTALLVYLIVIKIPVANRREVASLSYFLAIFCPFLWFSARMLYTEVLITFLVSLSILLICLAIEKGKYRLYFTAGVIAGVTILTRPALAFFPLSLVLLQILVGWKKEKLLHLSKKISIYLVAVMIIWSPWIIRNYLIFNKFLPLSIGSGFFLYLGTGSPSRYEDFSGVSRTEYISYLYKEGEEILAMDEDYRRKAIERIKQKPLAYIKYSIQRVPILWFSSFSHYFNIEDSMAQLKSQIKEKVSQGQYFSKELGILFFKLSLSLINIFYILTGILGIVLLLKYWRNYYYLLFVPFYFTFIHMFMGQANARYALPAWPILIIFSSYGLLSFYNRIRTYFYKV